MFNFRLCEQCTRSYQEQDGELACKVYTKDGQKFRHRQGHCPMSGLYLEGHPGFQKKEQEKKRIGQQKQRRNR